MGIYMWHTNDKDQKIKNQYNPSRGIFEWTCCGHMNQYGFNIFSLICFDWLELPTRIRYSYGKWKMLLQLIYMKWRDEQRHPSQQGGRWTASMFAFDHFLFSHFSHISVIVNLLVMGKQAACFQQKHHWELTEDLLRTDRGIVENKVKTSWGVKEE